MASSPRPYLMMKGGALAAVGDGCAAGSYGARSGCQERRHVARTINKEEVVFRREHQDITSRREFDIYDPDLLKKSLPPRIDDSAKNNPPSSLKMLAGEDLQYEERIKCQQQQQERWLTDHLEETDCARERDLRERAQTEEMLLAQDEYAMYLADNDRRIRHEINCDYARAHLCQAEEKRQKEQEAWEEEQRANEEEICLTNTSAFMTEDPCVQINRIQPHRYRKDHYKSMPPRAKQRIMCERKQQVCDVKVSRQVQLSAELEYAREQEMIRRLLVQKNAELACLRRQMKIELAQQLKKMSICKKIK
ncbi:hypothetical protein CBR_g39227 [Chara braunii]|uniref:Uncharacterized protein n=1 Tax=Chara braunii TaxID=69332 RepID=A0A388LRF5_CHABU|nr:hypothetical protein CBR_g39227 [Chara braunii]|eukprot:GBG84851.1 hypothetical protein CBR_g39227 [Chara braunii]